MPQRRLVSIPTTRPRDPGGLIGMGKSDTCPEGARVLVQPAELGVSQTQMCSLVCARSTPQDCKGGEGLTEEVTSELGLEG